MVHFRQIFFRLFDDHVGDQYTIHPEIGGLGTKTPQPEAQDRIEIGEDHQADGGPQGAQFRCQGQHITQARTVREGALAGPLDHRTVG